MKVAALRRWHGDAGRAGARLHLWCPACDDSHAVEVEAPGAWQWDGNLERPTVSPSIKVTGTQWALGDHFHKPAHHVAPGATTCCHSFLRSAVWEFLGDSTHALAGKTAPMVALPDWLVSTEEER